LDKRIKPIRQATNLGYLKNYNFLLTQVTGDVVAIQDADDWSDVHRIEKQIHALQLHKQVVMVGTNGAFEYAHKSVYTPLKPSAEIDGINEPFVSIPASIMFYSDLLKETTGMNEYFDKGTSMDRYFIMEMLQGKKAFHIDEPLYFARVLANSNHREFDIKKILTAEVFKQLLLQRQETGTDWLKHKHFDKIAAFEKALLENNKLLGEKYREHAVYQVDGNNFKAAYPLLIRSLISNPGATITYRSIFYFLRKFFQQRQ
jgi:glycosyltransferase involved in cell wall biosynthesis